MRWFKHITLSHKNQVLSELMHEFGAEGYGVWWLILEQIAHFVDKKNLTFRRYSLKDWSDFCKISTKKFKNIVKFLEKKEKLFLNFDGEYLTIDCPNILKYRDEWSKKKIKQIEKLRSNSGVTPEKLRRKEYRDQSIDNLSSLRSDKLISTDSLRSSVLVETPDFSNLTDKKNGKYEISESGSQIHSGEPDSLSNSLSPLNDNGIKGTYLAPNGELFPETANGLNLIKIKKKDVPNCPYQKFVDFYHENLPMCPRVLTLNKTRMTYIKARWTENPNIEYWEQYFKFVSESNFLTGKTQSRNRSSPPFLASLEWLVRPNNYAKVIEGFYHREVKNNAEHSAVSYKDKSTLAVLEVCYENQQQRNDENS